MTSSAVRISCTIFDRISSRGDFFGKYLDTFTSIFCRFYEFVSIVFLLLRHNFHILSLKKADKTVIAPQKSLIRVILNDRLKLISREFIFESRKITKLS